MISQGMLAKEIAYELGITSATVKFHRHSACLKLAAKNAPHLIWLAKEKAIIPILASLGVLLMLYTFYGKTTLLIISPSDYNMIDSSAKSEIINTTDYCVPDPFNQFPDSVNRCKD